ncbi:MAG: type II toxin-antitoxin system RelB/DinJ family antitoxin [Firmicutes bacterium]|nr:type II toxin-antitoxin system RelB/DinJ family antitoxin [Bacillota bacterium]
MERTATTTISLRLDREIKRQAEELFQSLGLNMSVALNMFLAQALYRQGLPFEVRMPNATTVEAMLEAERIGSDPTVRRYTDVEAALRELKA